MTGLLWFRPDTPQGQSGGFNRKVTMLPPELFLTDASVGIVAA
jgi:hypothetical protein